MGLDIIALRKAERWKGIDEDRAYDDGAIYAFVHPGFPGRNDGFDEGFYTGSESYGFRAGSYGGYNRWREWLSGTFLGVAPETVWANPDVYAGKPFVELINFADNEGVIGARTAGKLLADFTANVEEARTKGTEYEVQRYEDWQKAFGLAADEGLVSFA